MGHFLGVSHDKLYRSMLFISANISFVQNLSLELIKEHANKIPGWLIVDDTAITKIYSKVIQGVVCQNSPKDY